MSPPAAFRLAAAGSRALMRLELALAGSIFALAMALLTIDVIGRYGFNRTIAHLHEAVTIGFVWVFLLGAAALYARNEDIVIDSLALRLPARAREVLILLVYLLTALVMAVVLVEAIGLARRQWRLPTPSLRLPRGIYGLAVAVAAASMVYTSLVECWASLIGMKSGTRPLVWKGVDDDDDNPGPDLRATG
jgi:TRAP-type transport system small permease protein